MADSWLRRTFCGFNRNAIKLSHLILIITFFPCDIFPNIRDLNRCTINRKGSGQPS